MGHLTILPREDHPSAEDLCAYHAGELTASDQDQVAEHLVICDACADIVLGFGAMERAEVEEPLAADVIEGEWQAFRRAAQEPAPDDAKVLPMDLERGRRRPAPSSRVAWAIAAAASLLAVGLGLWGLALDSELRRPRANPQIHDLLPHGEALQRGAPSAPIEAPAEADLVLLFNPFGPSAPDEVSLRFFDQGGREVLAVHGVTRSVDGNYSLSVPPGALTGGKYEVEMTGRGGADPVLFRFALAFLDAAP